MRSTTKWTLKTQAMANEVFVHHDLLLDLFVKQAVSQAPLNDVDLGAIQRSEHACVRFARQTPRVGRRAYRAISSAWYLGSLRCKLGVAAKSWAATATDIAKHAIWLARMMRERHQQSLVLG